MLLTYIRTGLLLAGRGIVNRWIEPVNYVPGSARIGMDVGNVAVLSVQEKLQ